MQGAGWVRNGPAAVRLIAAKDGVTPGAMALGVQVKLMPGWWTYWRAPGDAGMPPNLDWSGSANLKWPPEMFWPKPLQRTIFGHSLRVYRDEVVFPLRAVASDPSKGMDLKLHLTFAVCKDVCIPLSAQVELAVPAKPGGQVENIPHHQALLARFEAEVPTANPQRTGLRIKNVRLLLGEGSPALAVDLVRAPRDATPLVLIEVAPGQAPEVAKSLGKPPDGGAWTFAARLEVDAAQAAKLAGRRVRVTVLDGAASLEQIWAIGAHAGMSGDFGDPMPMRQNGQTMRPAADGWKPRE